MFRLLLLAYIPNTQHIPKTTLKLQFGINLAKLRFISPNNNNRCYVDKCMVLLIQVLTLAVSAHVRAFASAHVSSPIGRCAIGSVLARL